MSFVQTLEMTREEFKRCGLDQLTWEIEFNTIDSVKSFCLDTNNDSSNKYLAHNDRKGKGKVNMMCRLYQVIY